MIRILNNIMASHSFTLVDIECVDDAFPFSLYKAQNIRREEYFLTLEIKVSDDKVLQHFLDNKAQEIFEEIQKSDKVERYFEKNCTMLICLEFTNPDRDLVLALEEDPYNFKKNVITYSPAELAALNNYISDNAIQTFDSDIVNAILNSNSGKDFLDFKKQENTQNPLYNLIIRIILKLPFIVYRPQEQKLENLSLQINKSLTPNLTETLSKILSYDWADELILTHIESIWGEKA